MSSLGTFGRYELLRRIAFGGMAEIFLAALRSDEGFEKRVVLKRILPQFGTDPAFVRMFIDEAVLAARISHPNIVQVYDFGSVEGVYFLAMEYVDGADLRCVLRAARGRHRVLDVTHVAALAEGVARGLSFAHNLKNDDGTPLGIVHRDVSPHNVMISRSGEAKLMDFGIAKAAARLTHTATGTIKGKVAYMAPEQAAGREVDKRSDQFALSLVLWECLSGERMFGGDSDLEMLRKVAACEVRPLKPLREDVPVELEQIVMRGLCADPAERYGDLSEMASALAAFRYSLGAAGAADLGELAVAVESTQGPPRRGTLALEVSASPEEGAAAEAPAPPAAEPDAAASWLEDASASIAAGASTVVAAALQEPVLPTEIAAQQERIASESPPTRWWRRAGMLATGGAVLLLLCTLFIAGLLVARLRASSKIEAAPVAAVPAAARLQVVSDPPGARILVLGRDTGLVTPAALPGQPLHVAQQVDLVLAGYRPWSSLVTLERREERIEARLAPLEETTEADGVPADVDEPATPAKTPLPAKKGKARAAPARIAGKEAAAATPVSGQGTLWLRSAGPWLDVYLGERKLGTTPLSGVAVPAGHLRLRLVNPRVGVERFYEMDVRRDEEVRRTVPAE